MKIKNWHYAATAGILLGMSFPPYPFPLFAFIGFVPLLFLFEQNSNVSKKYQLLYLTFFLYHGITNWWISSWQSDTDLYLMISGFAVWIVHPFFFMVPFIAYFYIKRRVNSRMALYSFPAIWVAFEWLHSLGELSYPWLTLGNTQIFNYYWIQFIDITGVWGASFLIVLANVIIYEIIANIRIKRSNSIGKSFIIQNNKYLTISLVMLFVLPILYGIYQSRNYSHNSLLETNKLINIGIVQPSINPWQKWDSKGIEQIELHKHLQDSLTNLKPIDLAIWSETAVPGISISINQQHYYPFLTEWLDSKKTSLLTGFSEYYIYPDNSTAPITARKWILDTTKLWEPFNSALLINPYPYRDSNPQIYRKSKLTPFAERFPYSEQLPFAQTWFQWGVGISSWGLGREQFTLKVNNGRSQASIGAVICIESIYPYFVAGFARKNADILSVITNDSWYDGTIGPEQHYQIAAIRAIETRRYIARTANSGVSGFITPTGKSLLRANQYEETAIAATIPLIDFKTIYVRFGDWFPILMFISSIIIIIVSFAMRFKSK